MVMWFGVLIIAVALIAAVIALVIFAIKKPPNDFTILPAVITAVLLIAQIIVMIIAPFVGNPAVGDPLEIWLYLITAFAMPIVAVVWALTDRTKWANLVLAVVQASVAVMTWRMLSLWLGF